MRRCYVVFTILLLILSFRSNAQFDIGFGGQLDFPLLYNKDVGSYNHSLGAVGPRLSFSYMPPNNVFYPSLTVHATGIQLPVTKINDLVVNMLFRQINVTLSARVKKQLQKGELNYGFGITGSHFDGYDVKLSGKSAINTRIQTDSSYLQTWMPGLNAGLEYIFPISTQKPLYLGIGGQLQYIYFYETGEKSNVLIGDPQSGNPLKVTTSLNGHMVNPGITLTLYYRFGNTDYYY